MRSGKQEKRKSGSIFAPWKEDMESTLTGELGDFHGEGCEHVVAEIKDLEVPQLPNGLGEGLELVGGQGQLLQVGELANVVGKHKEVVVAGIQLHQRGELKEVVNESLNVVGANDELLQPPESPDGVREGVGGQAVLAEVEGGQARELANLVGKSGEGTRRAVQLLKTLELLDGGWPRKKRRRESGFREEKSSRVGGYPAASPSGCFPS